MCPRVLLVTPEFYGIEKKIISELKSSGCEVEWFENKELAFDYHGKEAKLKLIRKLWFAVFFPRERYVREKIRKISDLRFDILFAINCFVISPYLFKKLKFNNPKLFSILYLWDSTSMYSWIKESRLFDKIYTFDRRDAENNGWQYMPNFYLGDTTKFQNDIQYDLFFTGKFSPDRFAIIEKIMEQCRKSEIRCFMRLVPVYKNSLHYRWIYHFLKKLRIRTIWINNYILNYEVCEGIIKRDYIFSELLKFEDIQKKLISSNVILDLNFKGQTGYSHRLIEALARGKKMITNNPYMEFPDFYNSDMIRIIDDKNPVIDCNWIKSDYECLLKSEFNHLELSSWLKSIINVENA